MTAQSAAFPCALHGVACAMARTLRAIRAGRFERAATLLFEALDLANETLPEGSAEQLRAFDLVELIATVGAELQMQQDEREARAQARRLRLASVSR